MLALRRPGESAVGVCVATMPVPNLQLRTLATAGRLRRADRQEELWLLNANVRCIARVIVDPRYRGLGLGTRLVREAIARLDVPIVEALAVMGHVHPIFERAGMRAFHGPTPPRYERMIEALARAGIEGTTLLDAEATQAMINMLNICNRAQLDAAMREFLRPYGKRRTMPDGIDRTRFILERLTDRPVYYIHEKLKIGPRMGNQI